MVMCAVSCEKEIKEEIWTDSSPIIQFKDPRFLEAILEYSNKYESIDRNNDGQISVKEASIVKSLNLGGGIRYMDEIRYFTALRELSCGNNQLTSLDLSNNTDLRELSCGNNQLTSLDLSNNTDLRGLSCGNNQLT